MDYKQQREIRQQTYDKQIKQAEASARREEELRRSRELSREKYDNESRERSKKALEDFEQSNWEVLRKNRENRIADDEFFRNQRASRSQVYPTESSRPSVLQLTLHFASIGLALSLTYSIILLNLTSVEPIAIWALAGIVVGGIFGLLLSLVRFILQIVYPIILWLCIGYGILYLLSIL